MKTIPKWLQNRQSKFQTCYEVWQELNNAALSKQLTAEQSAQADKMIAQWNKINEKLQYEPDPESEDFKEKHRIWDEEFYPLTKQIQKYWEEHGYTDFLIRKNGKVGVRRLDGSIAIPPAYDDVCFTYDGDAFFFQDYFVVKKAGKWGLVSDKGEILIPFEYDMIFRKPEESFYYVLMKDGRQGLAIWDFDELRINIKVACEMDAIFHVPGWEIVLFSKEGKWGWWWNDNSTIYHNYNAPEYDEIFIEPIEVVHQMEDDEDELFAVRKGDDYDQILYWTMK